ncbi:hypothetical protein CWATWH8502_2098 [Crocosphaera watsonii WH 8502]|uniref:Uncharacterized protein n=1 Tax=Crocosphaera watsonii WH 8502 TaxID=423474 RepID=T2IE86_CROWT|nr:hypothetical protein CWATWH8502_2098 [Crocosphaera watsonii WH 8502]
MSKITFNRPIICKNSNNNVGIEQISTTHRHLAVDNPL